MSEWKITYGGTVYPWHCDHMGHMNVMWYAGKFDEACWQLLAMLGLHRSRLAQDGTGMAAIEQHIQTPTTTVAAAIFVLASCSILWSMQMDCSLTSKSAD